MVAALRRLTEAQFRDYWEGGLIEEVEVIELPEGGFLVDGKGREREFRLKVTKGDHDRQFRDIGRLKEYLSKRLNVGRFHVVSSGAAVNDKQIPLLK